MGYNMKGSPAKLGTIQGTSGHASALKKKPRTYSTKEDTPKKDLEAGRQAAINAIDAKIEKLGEDLNLGKITQEEYDAKREVLRIREQEVKKALPR